MKKNLIYALLSATALFGAAGFSACTDSEDVAQNPNYNPETNEVTAQFVLNIARTSYSSTRMSAAVVQENGNGFRGIQDARLFALQNTGNSNGLAPYVSGTISAFSSSATGITSKMYDLGTLYAATDISDNSSNSHRLLQLTLPVKTDAALVYARAITTEPAAVDGKVAVAPLGAHRRVPGDGRRPSTNKL